MKPSIFILFFLFYFSNLWSQQIILDSLNQALQKETDPFVKIDLHLGIARASAFAKDNAQSERNIDLALELSQKYEWQEATIAAYLFKAVAEINKGSGSEVLYDYVQKARNLAIEINDKSGLAFANYHLAEYYIIDKNDPQKGLEVLEEALKKIDKTVPHKHLANIYKTKGAAHDFLGNEEMVLESYEKALSHLEKVKTNPDIVKRLGRKSAMDADDGKLNSGQVLVYLSEVYTHRGEFAKALLCSAKAISIYQSLQAFQEEAWAKETQAYTYKQQGDLSKAISGYQETIKIYENGNNIFRLIGAQITVGDLFF